LYAGHEIVLGMMCEIKTENTGCGCHAENYLTKHYWDRCEWSGTDIGTDPVAGHVIENGCVGPSV